MVIAEPAAPPLAAFAAQHDDLAGIFGVDDGITVGIEFCHDKKRSFKETV